jgi:predicted GIY-YIG superfamily endonuclease
MSDFSGSPVAAGAPALPPAAAGVCIYALLDRKTKSGYIGQTGTLAERSRAHVQTVLAPDEMRRGKNPGKARWLLGIASVRSVELRILALCASREEAAQKEGEFISRAESKGWRLLNLCKKPKVVRASPKTTGGESSLASL